MKQSHLRVHQLCFPVIILVLAIFGCSRKNEQTAVIEVGGQKLTSREFLLHFKSMPELREAQPVTGDIIRKILTSHVEEELLYRAAAIEVGLDRDSTFLAEMERSEETILTGSGGLLHEKIFPDEFPVSEAELTDFYNRSKVEIKTAHILVSSRFLADSIMTALDDGADFSALALRNSLDLSTRDQGGEVPDFFGPGTMGINFEKGLFDLEPGEIAPAAHSSYGYHIIKLLEKRERELPTLDSVRTDFTIRLKNLKMETYLDQFFSSLYDEFHFELNLDTADELISTYAGFGSERSYAQSTVFQDILEKDLAEWDDGKITVGEFLIQLDNAHITRIILPNNHTDIENFIKQAIVFDLMLLKSQKLKLDETEEFTERIEFRRNQLLSQMYRKQHLYDKVVVNDDDLRKFYEANQDQMGSQSFEQLKPQIAAQVRNEKLKERHLWLVGQLKLKYQTRFNDQAIEQAADELNEIYSSAAE